MPGDKDLAPMRAARILDAMPVAETRSDTPMKTPRCRLIFGDVA